MGLEEKIGDIKISQDVVASLATIAAMEVEGISIGGGKFSVGDIIGKKDKGVHAAIEGNKVSVDIEVRVEYGKNIYDVAYRLQKRIKDAVEQLTGMEVEQVNVLVKGLLYPREKLEDEMAEGEEDVSPNQILE